LVLNSLVPALARSSPQHKPDLARNNPAYNLDMELLPLHLDLSLFSQLLLPNSDLNRGLIPPTRFKI
jgi:hypothetical protein